MKYLGIINSNYFKIRKNVSYKLYLYSIHTELRIHFLQSNKKIQEIDKKI